MLRGADGEVLQQDQWDLPAKDLPWLRETMGAAFEAGLKQYLETPANPALNRQARYLVGFERVPCEEQRCCGICSRGPQATPRLSTTLRPSTTCSSRRPRNT